MHSNKNSKKKLLKKTLSKEFLISYLFHFFVTINSILLLFYFIFIIDWSSRQNKTIFYFLLFTFRIAHTTSRWLLVDLKSQRWKETNNKIIKMFIEMVDLIQFMTDILQRTINYFRLKILYENMCMKLIW